MKAQAHIAVDFGGGSGRVMAGIVDGATLKLEEVHRFPNRLCRLGGHDFWDFPHLFREMTEGLRKAAVRYRILSVGVDTWGVDFGLVDSQGMLMGLPISYRDSSVSRSTDRFFAGDITPGEFYAQAGTQIMDIDTIFRLVDFHHSHGALLDAAAHLLFTPDLFNFFLTGRPCCEATIASTSGLLDPRTRKWNDELIDRCRLPRHIFPPVVEPGTPIGNLTPDVAQSVGIDYPVTVVAVGSHDTASAIAAVSGTFDSDGTAFLSSGTWSLLGASIDRPITSEEARKAGFTNECGIEGTICFLQNITGLWILQRLVDEWGRQGLETDYGKLVEAARLSKFSATIDVDSPAFHNPASMTQAITGHFASVNHQAPTSQPDIVRCILLSLAERYRRGIDGLEKILNRKVRRLQIIGGGSRNTLLNELTAQATSLTVESGPAEATAIGNILVQARAIGTIDHLSSITTIL